MIAIKNIYYMLTYAFKYLKTKGYENIELEEFDNNLELWSAILIKGLSIEIKRGLFKQYRSEQEYTNQLKGKIDISKSLIRNKMIEQKMYCEYDEFSENCYENQIIKSTLDYLLKSSLSKIRKSQIRKLMIYFNEVSLIPMKSINWNLHYHKNNQNYRILIMMCYLIHYDLIQTQQDGKNKAIQYEEEYMCRLYEKFILEYYKKEHPELEVTSSQIKWNVDDNYIFMLPIMQSDVMLKKDNKTLIIDAKYYSNMTQIRYDQQKIHSNNLYQIFTYVKNEDRKSIGNVSGLLLYAQTDNNEQLNQTYCMSGNKILVKSLDLNCDFNKIKKQLDDIVNCYFE